jgi:hypothetical protein
MSSERIFPLRSREDMVHKKYQQEKSTEQLAKKEKMGVYGEE